MKRLIASFLVVGAIIILSIFRDLYVPFELYDESKLNDTDDVVVYFDRKNIKDNQKISIRGFWSPEELGSWSKDKKFIIEFDKCLPSGSIILSIEGNAYYPTDPNSIDIEMGNSRGVLVFDSSLSVKSIKLDVQEVCPRKLSGTVVKQGNPYLLRHSIDDRELGVFLKNIRIHREQNDN